MSKVKVAIIGTSWWSDAMYLPALQNHERAELVAVVGRNLERTESFAKRWNIPQYFVCMEDLYTIEFDALIIATDNRSHYPLVIKALEKGKHVLCEKPFGLNASEAKDMLDLAEEKKLVNMVPFTYRYMPFIHYIRDLVHEGYLGKPYHLNLRYFASYGRDEAYSWRFDEDEGGEGVISDLGSHCIHLARWILGDIRRVSCQLQVNESRPHPQGKKYRQECDGAFLQLEFKSGAMASIHLSTVAYEDTSFGETQGLEIHGSEGTLHGYCDYNHVHIVEGARQGEGPCKELSIPEKYLEGLRQDNVHNMYKDIFRKSDTMARSFISAIAASSDCEPDFKEGWEVRRVIDAAKESARLKKAVDLSPTEVSCERGLPGLKGTDHIGFTVPNLKEAVLFFKEVIGCEEYYTMGPLQASERELFRRLDVPSDATIMIQLMRCASGANFEIFEYQSSSQRDVLPRNSDHGGHHLAFYVDDIEAAVDYLKKKGIEVQGEAEYKTEGESAGESWVYFKAPWGMQLELVSYPKGKAYEKTFEGRLWDPRQENYKAASSEKVNCDELLATIT